MGKLFVACLATFVVLSFLWNTVAADEENRPAKQLLFDALGMELNDPRKRRKYYLVKNGRPHYRYGKKSGGRKSGSDTSDSDSDSDSDSSGSDSGSDTGHSGSDTGHSGSDSDGGKRRHGKRGKSRHGSGSDSGKYTSDEAEM